MYLILLSAQLTINANVAQEVASQAPTNDIIGIGGIIATLLVGIVTCLVTWKLTLKSIKQLKISYNIQVFPILSNSVTKSTEINLDDLKIQYMDKVLSNPCLLALEIVNSGNDAINDPPIKIRTDENIEIMKAYMCKQRGIRLIKLPMKGTELDYANSLKKAFQSVHIFISSDTEEDVEIIKNIFERWRDSQ